MNDASISTRLNTNMRVTNKITLKSSKFFLHFVWVAIMNKRNIKTKPSNMN